MLPHFDHLVPIHFHTFVDALYATPSGLPPQTNQVSALVVPPHGLEDSGHHEPSFQGRDHTQEGFEEPGGRSGDPHQDLVQGDQDHPAQTLSILRSMMQNVLHFTLVFVVAATALRSSEVLSLRWADILWEERKIRVVKSWKKTGVDGDTKTPSSERDVPLGRVLTHYLREWHKQTPYAKPTDFVFPSIKESGRVPICASVFCADHLRPAAKAAGVIIPDGHRWGLHNLRHSLSNWLVNKAKENPKTVQGILVHSRIQTTLDLYTDEDLDEMIAAQEKFLDAVGFKSGSVQ
jgi:hypothetical protein